MVRMLICCFHFSFYITFSENASTKKKMRIYQTPVSYVPPAETDTLLAQLQYRVAAVELQLPKPRSTNTMYA